ncbi:MAG: hypothetical protein ACREH3_04895 [Geminicoccales bacterium]
MNAQIVGGIVRHLLTAVGGYFVATGALDAGTMETVIGAVVTLAGIGWSVWTKAREA